MSKETQKKIEGNKSKQIEKTFEKRNLKLRTRIYNDMIRRQKLNVKKLKTAPENAFISLKNVNKIYDNKVQAVYDFNLDIKEHEFIVLVGPSGCGKSTTLRMIAGLEDITYGDLFIDGVFANDLHHKDRDLAMVFQSYALYPHMNVRNNMAFGIKIRKVPTLKVDEKGQPLLGKNKKLIARLKKQSNSLKKNARLSENEEELKEVNSQISELQAAINYLENNDVEIYEEKHVSKDEIKNRVDEAAKILQIDEYLNRLPKTLSGGQKQRVALGRAIVRNAKVFLMDEPLSNLDAKLRITMRSEIVRLHNQLKATTIYVTHDQTEAMTMATRIVVMNQGYIQQIGTPSEIYNKPANLFVATFVGAPAMNLFKVKQGKDYVVFENGFELKLNKEVNELVKKFYQNEKQYQSDKLAKIDAAFIERTEQLKEIANIKEKLGEKNSLTDQEKLKKELIDAENNLLILEQANEARAYCLEMNKQLAEVNVNEPVNLIFGIRPEDIYTNKRILTDGAVSSEVSLPITFAELLGKEYYIHTEFADKNLIAKVYAQDQVEIGGKIELVFDLDKCHVFDPITQKIIF